MWKWLVLSLALVSGCHMPPPPPYVPTATELDTMYRHVVWTRGWNKKPYIEAWTRGFFVAAPSWYDTNTYVRLYLGNRWESFEYRPSESGYDNVVNLPAVGYNGPDRMIYYPTGEVVDYQK